MDGVIAVTLMVTLVVLLLCCFVYDGIRDIRRELKDLKELRMDIIEWLRELK